ncbi:PAAR domain-containing protein [Caballeronia sp. GAFFF1]|uniref:PAAR domain-containing protein n=1 Tax=Caballeronia sp. GAFFF1 TaxID=2921779 RepID=UPI002027F682|nr:PAAR domain-containing protein [Caballeronia sp. GAFFF1]
MERSTVAGRAQIVVGDATDHGGRVVSGSPSSTWGPSDIPIARKGDKVTCPRCTPHVFVIAEGYDDSLDFGAPVALEGHSTTCGALLIARLVD